MCQCRTNPKFSNYMMPIKGGRNHALTLTPAQSKDNYIFKKCWKFEPYNPYTISCNIESILLAFKVILGAVAFLGLLQDYVVVFFFF